MLLLKLKEKFVYFLWHEEKFLLNTVCVSLFKNLIQKSSPKNPIDSLCLSNSVRYGTLDMLLYW